MIWTDEKCVQLCELWLRSDQPSRSQIGAIMGVSAQAIDSKVRALGLALRRPGYFFRPTWNPYRLEELRRMRCEENRSSSFIAGVLGVTRNAVIGAALRAGLASPHQSLMVKPARVKPPRIAIIKAAPAEKTKPKPPTPVRPELKQSGNYVQSEVLKQIWELGPSDCKYPIGDPQKDGFGFCAQEQDSGSVYCVFHHKLSVQPRPASHRPAFVLRRSAA